MAKQSKRQTPLVPKREVRASKLKFYDKSGEPIADFNINIKTRLSQAGSYQRPSPKAFDKLLQLYKTIVADAREQDPSLSHWRSHRYGLNRLTDVMFGVDLRPELQSRLTSQEINVTGFRTTLAQGVAKNTGEAFINLILYALADALCGQDEVIVDRGLAAVLRKRLTLTRKVSCEPTPLSIPLEVDLCIFKRSDPEDAILLSAKTRLKEVFHIAVMWKMLFDTIRDPHLLKYWDLSLPNADPPPSTAKMLYTFATADMIRKTGRKTQGPDLDRDTVRNLLKVDASFLDYVFVSKTGIKHVSDTLVVGAPREALFHELGCLLDLIAQKFKLEVD